MAENRASSMGTLEVNHGEYIVQHGEQSCFREAWDLLMRDHPKQLGGLETEPHFEQYSDVNGGVHHSTPYIVSS